MKPFLIAFVVVLIGGGIVGAVILHSHQASSTPIATPAIAAGYHGNGVSTYYSAGQAGYNLQTSGSSHVSGADGTPAQPIDGISEVSGNPDQKIVSDPKNKAYQDDSLDEQVQEEKNENRPVQSNQPK